jgi:hypothetical protein
VRKCGDRRNVPHFPRVRHAREFESWRFRTAWNRELVLRFMRLHVGAEDGIDSGLIAAFAAGGISECEHRKLLPFFLIGPLRCCHPTLAKCARVGHSPLALSDHDSENFHARKGNIEF